MRVLVDGRTWRSDSSISRGPRRAHKSCRLPPSGRRSQPLSAASGRTQNLAFVTKGLESHANIYLVDAGRSHRRQADRSKVLAELNNMVHKAGGLLSSRHDLRKLSRRAAAELLLPRVIVRFGRGSRCERHVLSSDQCGERLDSVVPRV